MFIYSCICKFIDVAYGKVPLWARGREDVCENTCFFISGVNIRRNYKPIVQIYENVMIHGSFHNLFEKAALKGNQREPKGAREPKGVKVNQKGAKGSQT